MMDSNTRADCENSYIPCRGRQRNSWHVGSKIFFVACMVAIFCTIFSRALFGQERKDQGEFSPYVGDSPSVAMPHANDISDALTHEAIAAALRKVADWQIKRAQSHFDRDWTFAVLYAGFMAVPDEAGGEKYRAAMKTMGKSFHWELGPDKSDANDLAIGQTYLALYKRYKDPNMLLPTQRQMDQLLQQSGTAGRPLWWWCDALFMAPPTLAELSEVTKRDSYLDYMNRQWWRTSAALYDQKHHLFFRDARFLSKHDVNGQPIFWSRGNGWVMAGLVRVLKTMPKNYPSRPRYIAQFRQMAADLIAVQRSDGLWSSDLLDSTVYKSAETSGTSLITYALAYGIKVGILDRRQYEPHVRKAWSGLVSHIYMDGRLGAIQPVDDSPGRFRPTSSYVYGVGAFLLAGSEIYRLTAAP